MESFSDRVSRPTLNTPERKDETLGQREVPPVRRVSDEPKGRGPRGRGKRYMLKVLIVLVAIAVVLGSVWWFLLRNIGIPSYINTSEYQVACLQSGECYFGKVTAVTNDVIIIRDVFYVQKSTTATATTTTDASNNNLELIKLGNEVHGPEDQMVLTRSSVLYVENLKPSGKVTQTIQTYHQQNK